MLPNNAIQRIIKLREGLILEKSFELSYFKEIHQKQSHNEKIMSGILLYPIEFKTIHYNTRGNINLIFKNHPNLATENFKSGQNIEIIQGNETKLKGNIDFINIDEIKVQIYQDDDDIEYWIKDGKIGIQMVANTNTFDFYLEKIDEILRNSTQKIIQAFYEIRSNPVPLEKVEYSNPNLNSSQIKVIKNILSGASITLVHGPPGTGKSTTVIEAIKVLIQSDKKILLTAPTHAAIDHLCRKLSEEKCNYLRLGNPVKMEESVQKQTLDERISQHAEFKLIQNLSKQENEIHKKINQFKRNFGETERKERNLLKNDLKNIRKDIRKIKNNIRHYIMDTTPIVAGTFYSIGNESISNQEFDYIIIDEGGQAIEPAIWSIIGKAENMIVAGDPFQIPPTVMSQEANKTGLNQSLLEMAIEIKHPLFLLNEQYRMNDVIMGYSNSYFYEGKVKSHPNNQFHHIENDNYLPIEFIDTAGTGYLEEKKHEKGSISNPGEVEILEKKMKELNLEKHSFIVLTPYKNQESLIKEKLPLITNQVSTIDSFQGQEREIVFVSLVRSNETNEIGFLKDYRRINVAFTRAQKKLILIGDSSTIGNDTFFSEFLNYIEKNGTYRSAWEFFN